MRRFFVTGELIPKTAVYKVEHRTHRLISEVALLEGQRFPCCSQCSHDVTFTLMPNRQLPADWTIVIDTLPTL